MIYAVNKRTLEHRILATPSEHAEVDSNLDWKIIEADPDGWLKWDGGECPLPDEAPCEYKHQSGRMGCLARAGVGLWVKPGSGIIAYRPILDADTNPEPPAWRPGDECEWVPAGCSHGDHCVIAIHEGVAWITNGDGAHDFADLCDLYPIRSEEDCFVDAVNEVMEAEGLYSLRRHARALYRAGYRKQEVTS